MKSIDGIARMIDVLEALSVPYMIVGSFATNLYARARSTEDIDFVIELRQGLPLQIAEQLGAAFRFDFQMSFETITMTTRHKIELLGSAFTIELFHLRDDDPFDRERFARRRKAVVIGKEAYVATVEDMIVNKLRWLKNGGRSKDSTDIEAMLGFNPDSFDWPYIESWADCHGTRELLTRIRASVPKF